MDEEKKFYNAVAIALEGDPRRVRKQKEACGDLFDTWKIAYGRLIKAGHSPPDPEIEWRKMQSAGIRLILFDDPEYPKPLRQIHAPPLGLYILGEFPKENAVAIVGTRRGTAEGKSTAKKFARELSEAGFVIVSGLALGIDAAAHVGCLEGNGKTIAVLAGGLDTMYPAQNERLAKHILERGGAIISEYPIGEPTYPYRFLERNRIVSGLSKGILLVEAPRRSGSLATATFAVQQNRDLFVVPGPISHPNFFGSHQLIRQGAELVTGPRDIFESYTISVTENAIKETAGASDEENQILLALRSISGGAHVDKIIEATKLEPRIANRALSFLLLKHLITETETGYIIE